MTKTLFQSAQRTCQILAALEHLGKDVAGTAYVSGPGMTSTSKSPNNDKNQYARVDLMCGPQHLCPCQGRRDGTRLGDPVSVLLDKNEAWSNQTLNLSRPSGPAFV